MLTRVILSFVLLLVSNSGLFAQNLNGNGAAKSDAAWRADALDALHRKDYTAALRILQPQAESGDPWAQYFVGSMYDLGQGVPQDYKEAVQWYYRAAVQGDAFARYAIGSMYREGNGLPRDYVRAYLWLDFATQAKRLDASGLEQRKIVQKAAEDRDAVLTSMSATQRDEAQEFARTWKPEGVPTISNEHQPKLIRFWQYEQERWKNCNRQQLGMRCGEEYFRCDYTSRTCARGYQFMGTFFLFTLLADDRNTEMDHRFCLEGSVEMCLSFDTGEVRGVIAMNGRSMPSMNFDVQQDIDASCLDFTRNRRARFASCDPWIRDHFPPLSRGLAFPLE